MPFPRSPLFSLTFTILKTILYLFNHWDLMRKYFTFQIIFLIWQKNNNNNNNNKKEHTVGIFEHLVTWQVVCIIVAHNTKAKEGTMHVSHLYVSSHFSLSLSSFSIFFILCSMLLSISISFFFIVNCFLHLLSISIILWFILDFNMKILIGSLSTLTSQTLNSFLLSLLVKNRW